MTVEERFERMEHVTAALVEERRKDREEYRMLWRENQRQINDLTIQIAELKDSIAKSSEETGKLFKDTDRKINLLADQDRHLGERIEALVSAIGALAQQKS
jgi:transposase